MKAVALLYAVLFSSPFLAYCNDLTSQDILKNTIQDVESLQNEISCAGSAIAPPVCSHLLDAHKKLSSMDLSFTSIGLSVTLSGAVDDLRKAKMLLSQGQPVNRIPNSLVSPKLDAITQDLQDLGTSMVITYINRARGDLTLIKSKSEKTESASQQLRAALFSMNKIASEPTVANPSLDEEQASADTAEQIKSAREILGVIMPPNPLRAVITNNLATAEISIEMPQHEDLSKTQHLPWITASLSGAALVILLATIYMLKRMLPLSFEKEESSYIEAIRDTKMSIDSQYRRLRNELISLSARVKALEEEKLSQQQLVHSREMEALYLAKNENTIKETIDVQKDCINTSGPIWAPIILDPLDSAAGVRQSAASHDNPLSDYKKASLSADDRSTAAFKSKYSPSFVLTCTNLAQRGIANSQLAFTQDMRGIFLAITNTDKAILLFPQFGYEFWASSSLIEGVFLYPSGDSRELQIVKPAEVESTGTEWKLKSPGQFEYA